MIDRREAVGGGLAGLAALLASGDVGASSAREDDKAEVARAIDDLRRLLERRLVPPFAELSEIRRQQRIFLKASQQFPEFIEIGIDVWERLYDWHVRHQQPLAVARLADGRYTMSFMFTTLVLRPEQADDFVSFGYDAR